MFERGGYCDQGFFIVRIYIVVFRQALWRWVLGCSWEAVGLF